MRARLLLAALGLALSCGSVRNSDLGTPITDAGFADPGLLADGGVADCNCRGGFCCGDLCCNLGDLCCEQGGGAVCIQPRGVDTTCFDFGATAPAPR